MGWKDDARLSVHLYGDTDNFIFLSIQQDKDSPIIGKELSKEVGVGIEHTTPENIGEAIANYLRENFWKEKDEMNCQLCIYGYFFDTCNASWIDQRQYDEAIKCHKCPHYEEGHKQYLSQIGRDQI